MITYYIKKEGRLREIDAPELGCWVNITPPFSQEELEDISQNFQIPIDFLTDSLDIDERSRYDKEVNVRHIVLNSPTQNEALSSSNAFYITVPIGVILTADHVLTITSFEHTILDLFLKDKIRNFDPIDDKNFVLQLLEQNVYAYLNALKKLNLQRNLIEKKLLISTENEHLIELLRIEKSLVYFVNALSVTELLNMKMKRSDFLQLNDDQEKIELFEDIIIDTSQALQMANIYANIQGSTMETYGSIISNNVNAVMQRLTLITILISVPTLVASIFGMNVPLFNLEQNPNAIYFVLMGSILLSVFLIWFFRRKKLL
jgi:magnesium transporter